MSGQGAFAEALLAPDLPVPEGLSDPHGAPAGKRFDVYRNNVVVSLSEALAAAFPVVQKLLGEANFKVLARAFLTAHPPRDPRLMLWGDALPGFLETFPPVAKLGYLPDVARLEQAMRESYHAADATPFNPSVFATLSPEELMTTRLGIAPAVRLLASKWPVLSIWRFNTVPDAPKPVMAAEEVLICRPDFDPLPAALPPGGVAFIAALERGETLGDALAADGVPEDFTLDTALAAMLQGGALTETGDQP